jgi:hypothetical protein
MWSTLRLHAVDRNETAVNVVCVCVREREREVLSGLVPARAILSRREETNSSHIPPLVAERTPFQNTQGPRKNKNLVMGPDKARDQNLLCWRRPAIF